MLGVTFAITATSPVHASTSTIDPELEKQEREVEHLLKSAEAEFWSLKQRLDNDRNNRELRLAEAKAAYERAQRSSSTASAATDRNVASHRADEARERYHIELERALASVEASRTALQQLEARVAKYREALDAIRRRSRGASQQPGSTPSVPDSSAVRAPITTSDPVSQASCS